MKKQIFWAGFSNCKVHVNWINDQFNCSNHRRSPALFRTKREAMQQYQDVRKVKIVEVKP